MNRPKIIVPIVGILAVSSIWWIWTGDRPESLSPAAEEGTSLPSKQNRQPLSLEQSKNLPHRKRDRSQDPREKAAAAQAMAEELIRLSNMDEGESGRSEMTLEFMEELARFDSQQLQSVLSHVSSSSDIKPVSKAEACGFLLPVLARIDPITALDLRLSLQPVFQDHDDVLPLPKLLESVAEKDPAVAAEWREKHLPGSD